AELLGALDQEELQCALSLQLHRYARLRLQAAREQHGRGDALAEQAPQVGRVVVLRDDLLPGLLEPHERAADAAALEQKALPFVHAVGPRVTSLCGARP